jgi:protein O-mannosyl-transferase
MNPGNDATLRKVTMGLVFTGLVLFAGSLNDPFHFDDALFLNDSNVMNAARWPHFLNPLHLRQLTFFSFYLNHLIGGTSPVGYHAANILLHIANAVLLFILLRRVLNARIAMFASFVFLAHPIQTEPVLYIYQRSVLLACLFSLLALLVLPTRRYWLVVLCFVCAFESKESALAVPLLVVFWRQEYRRAVSWVALLVVLAFGAAALGLLAYHGEDTVGFGVSEIVSPFSYFLTQTRVIYTYLRLLVFPLPQSLEYDFVSVQSFSPGILLNIAGVCGLIVIGWMLARSERWRVTGLAMLAFFVLLAPTSSFIPSADAAFEHRLYLPMLAFAVFVSSLIVRIKRPVWVAFPLLAACSILTVQRGRVWSSDTALWEDTVSHTPNKARAWFNLAGAYMQINDDRSTAAYRRALELQPHFPEAFYNLGVMEQKKGNSREAVAYYRQAVDLDREYWPAWNNLGNTLLGMGESERALEAYDHTLRLNPDHWPSQYNIAIVHYTAGRFDKAIPRLQSVLEWRPDFRDARYLLAVSLSRTGQTAEAEREWQRLGNIAGQPPMPAPISVPTR